MFFFLSCLNRLGPALACPSKHRQGATTICSKQRRYFTVDLKKNLLALTDTPDQTEMRL